MVRKYSVNLYLRDTTISFKKCQGHHKRCQGWNRTEFQTLLKMRARKTRSLSVIFTLSSNNSKWQSLFTLTANCSVLAVQVPGADSVGRAVSNICALLPHLQLCENTSKHWNGKHRVAWSVLCLPSPTTDWNINARNLHMSTKNVCLPNYRPVMV